MDEFTRQQGELFCGRVPLSLIAREIGTPVYVYSRAAIEESFRRFDRAFAPVPHLVCYAVKANSSLAILRCLCALGSGADVVSGGELQAARDSGFPADRIVFSGVGKTDGEIRAGILAGVLAFNAESEREIVRIDRLARELHRRARVALRVNPDIDAKSHPHISTGLAHNKFGVAIGDATAILRRSRGLRNIRLVGVQAHIGSQILEAQPLVETASELARLSLELAAEGFRLETLDLGGGLGVGSSESGGISPEDYAAAVLPRLAGLSLRILVEPGRSIVARAGVLVTRVIGVKVNGGRRFVVTDAGMNDLIRPALYGAVHTIQPLATPRQDIMTADVVGPICETSDVFAEDARLPEILEGEIVAIGEAGAYGFAMSSNYNFRPRPAEVMVEADSYRVIRRRETYEDLVRLETEQ